MVSLKSLSKFLYVIYFGLFCLVSFISFLSVGAMSLLIMKSKDILFVSNMVSFHKVILILLLFATISYLLIKLFLYIYAFTGKFDHLDELVRISRKLIITATFGFISIILYYKIGIVIGHPFAKDIIEMNILAIIVFLGIIDLAKYLSTNYTKHVKSVLSVMLIILFYRSFASVLNGNIPLEFSSVAYLFVPFVLVLRIEKLYVIASYIAVLAGTVYYLYIIVNGGATYNVLPASEVYLSMFSHGTLLLIGIITMLRLSFIKNNYFLIIGYMLFNIIWAISNRPEYIEFRLFIYELIDGNFLEMFIQHISPFIYTIYYGLISSFLILSIMAFNILNAKWNIYIKFKGAS